jgi:hypothetical protein
MARKASHPQATRFELFRCGHSFTSTLPFHRL